jgi:putative transcriptional regulator
MQRMDLSGQCLVAMPALSDPRFERSLVVLCRHSPEGAMGLIVNKPLREVTFAALLDQMGVARDAAMREVPVQFGGPVEPGRGFVLHGSDYQAGRATMRVRGGLAMTATRDVLAALAGGGGPRRALLALGYAGWGPGQLETEILRNDWLTVDAPAELIFSPDSGAKWSRALALLGIDPLMLSSSAGRA